MRMNPGGLRLCVGALIVAAWVGAGCYPGEIDSASQTDVVLTFHAPNANFTANQTLAMPDSIVDVGVAAGAGSTFDHQYDAQILAKIKTEFEAQGYTFPTNPAGTDAVVVVSGITVDNYQAWSGYPWYPYWGWWPYWPAGYGAGSNWYYPWTPVVVTSYKSGTLFINLVDPDVPPASAGDLASIWGAALNGMLEGTNTEILSRIGNNIQQAFIQSPYLKTQ
jgi:hypothetical protein